MPFFQIIIVERKLRKNIISRFIHILYSEKYKEKFILSIRNITTNKNGP